MIQTMMVSWQGLPQEIREQYAVIRLIKRTEEKEIVLLQDKSNGTRVIVRNYPTEPSQIYKILYGKNLQNIPQILMAKKRPGGSFVLEEFIEGKTPNSGNLAQTETLEVLHDL